MPESPRTSDNARRFPAETLDRLAAVKGAQRLGLALADITRLLDAQDAGRCPCAITRRLLSQRLDDLGADIAALVRQRDDVAVVLADPTALHDEGRLMTRDEPTRHSRLPRGKRARADSGLRRPALAHIAAQPTHAYAVWRHLVAEGHANPTSPRHVYRALTRLEADGLVTPHWDLSDPGPGRRIYTITPKAATPSTSDRLATASPLSGGRADLPRERECGAHGKRCDAGAAVRIARRESPAFLCTGAGRRRPPRLLARRRDRLGHRRTSRPPAPPPHAGPPSPPAPARTRVRPRRHTPVVVPAP